MDKPDSLPPIGTSDLKTQYPAKNLRFYIGVASICFCCFIATVDTVILATALPSVTQALSATSIQAYWCGTGFLFAQTIVQPIYGTVQEIYGHKTCLIFALVVFLLASVLCATAQSIEWLVGARVVQGLGGGGINVMVNVLISDMAPLHERGIYLGLINMAGAIGLVSGVVLGAAFSERSTWRWIFYLNLPICLIAGVGILLGVQLPHAKARRSLAGGIRRIDWIGLVTFTASLVGILYGVTAGGVLHPWNSPRVICALVFGSTGVVIFILYEILAVPASPVIPLRIFSDRTAAAGFFFAWGLGIVLWSLAYYLILYFLIARGHSLLRSAIEILPGIASIPACAAICGFSMAYFQTFKYHNIAAWILLSVGVGLLATLTSTTLLWHAYGFQLILAVGGGILFPGRLLSTQAPQKPSDVPVATALVSFFTSFGEAVGVGVGGTVIQNRWDRLTDEQIERGNIPPQFRIPGKFAESAAEKMRELPESVQVLYREVMSGSARTLWITLATVCVVGFLVSLGQRNVRLDKEVDSEESTSGDIMVESADVEGNGESKA